DVTLCEVMPDGTTVHFQYGKTYFKALEFIGGTLDSNYLIPKHIFKPEQYGGDAKAFGDAFNAHPFREKPVYTGPYRVKEWKRGDVLTLERNPNYWKNGIREDRLVKWKHEQPYLDEISFVLYRDPGPTVKDLQNGVIDADFNVEPSTWVQPETKSAEFTSKMVRAEIPYPDYTYIGWNLINPLFKDLNVRKALAMLIPRDEIIKNVYQGVAVPTNGPFYRFGPGYDSSVEPIKYDPEGAKKLLTRAGWLDRDGDGVLEKEIDGKVVPFRFRYAIHNARDYHQKVADIIKESIEQAKIQMTIVKSDWAIYADTIRDKNFDATRFASTVELDPDPFQIWHSSQMENKGDNFFSYSNPKVDDLCVRIRETIDPEERWKMAMEIHRIVYADQPVCFLESFDEEYFYNRKLHGIKFYAGVYPQNFCEFYWSEIPENRR
ncbi:MAG: ABC transporter substrate-binding protein, partial [Candidatus Sumerlaeota bacterium]